MSSVNVFGDVTPKSPRLAFVAVLLMGFIAVATLAIGFENLLAQQDEASRMVIRTQDILLRASKLEVHLQTAVSEGRGYRFSGAAQDLAALEAASSGVDADLAGVRDLTADNPRQQRAIDRLKPLISARLTLLRRIAGISPFPNKPLELSPQLVEETISLSKLVSSEIDEITAEEVRLLTQHQTAADRTSRRLTVAIAIGGAILSASVILLAFLAALRRREHFHLLTLRAMNDELEQRVEARTEELRRLAEALRASDEIHRRYLENAPFAMSITSRRENGEYFYEYMNLACENVHGARREAFIGRTLRQVWADDVASDIERRLDACEIRAEPFEPVVERQIAGKTKFFDDAYTPLEHPVTGQRQVLMCARDVTARVELERHIAALASRQAGLLEREAAFFKNSDDVLFMFRVETTPTGVAFVYETLSPKLEERTGLSPSRLLGRRVEDCLPDSLAEIVIWRNMRCVGARATTHYTESFDLPIGTRIMEGSLTPLIDGETGQVTRIVGWIRDVTERVRQEEERHQSRKMEALGQMAAGIAHDFNNLLQVIAGNLEVALGDIPATAPTRELVSNSLKAAHYGANLTQPLLTYARGQALWPVAIDPVALVSETRLMFERVIGPRVAVQVSLASDTPALFADPAHLNAALVNLAVNASHAMPDGGVLTFGVHAASEGDLATVILTVADTGVGMDGMTLARAADPFFTTRGLNGTGLGLSLVKGFVEQSGGTMSIASRVGEGTRVELVLPQAKAALANARGRPIPWLPGHILVVDDNADILRTTDRILAKAGHQTETAANGLAALALLERGMRFDALVTDFVMTGLNGADLIERCRLLQPGLPSLIITGFAQVGNTLGLPADVEVLRKPFQGVQLLQMVQSLMARQSVDAKSDKNS